jgi:hypothetical protein
MGKNPKTERQKDWETNKQQKTERQKDRKTESMKKIQKNTGAEFSFLQFWWRQLADRVPFSTGIM